ncbi:hypothetical protein WL01_22510 [Burkholderia ubonensis]|uniref:hypothetical protein n=1 Tax=Burkholderia ubonensis TaxID=101571 RepID=UPI00075538A3|nr:hypothetical protein [Burkholderia ubonensis]KVX10611.1 hypothetical protein WL01_22510 [Burkholderia ubonensis]KWB37634.1 hypothetical protein WL33_14775 [Burkholderia ubonensis]KWC32457.1 hypothetical protein WL50_23860 [Burkholderia ubonensis]
MSDAKTKFTLVAPADLMQQLDDYRAEFAQRMGASISMNQCMHIVLRAGLDAERAKQQTNFQPGRAG